MRQNEILDELNKLETICQNINKAGCYMLCLCYACFKEERNLEQVLSIYKTLIDYKWMDDDCYIKDPCSILKYFTGNDWKVEKTHTYDEGADIKIARFFNKRTGLNHFVLMQDEKTVLWDPIEDSVTVREGRIESWRLFYGVD